MSKSDSDKLAGMSREEKLRLYEILQEKKRRLRAGQAAYSPNEGQSVVHESRAQLRCVFSGNGAGKTALTVNEVLWMAQGYNPILKEFTKVPARIIVLLDAPDKVTDVWLPELRKWTNFRDDQLHKRGKPYVTHISIDNGSEIIFMFHDQQPLLFESIELDYLITDEPPPRHVFIALRRGARKKGRKPRFLMVGTPISASWMRTEIYDPWAAGNLPNTECFRFGTEVNKNNLADGYEEEMGRHLTEKEKLIRFKGQFFDLDGLALAHLFDRRVHIVPKPEWDSENPCVIVIDPHPSKAHHAILLGVDEEDRLFYLDEYREKVIARGFMQALLARGWMDQYKVIDIVYDSLGSADTTSGEGFRSFGDVINEVLAEDGRGRARATSYADKSDEDFIERIRDALAIPAHPDNFGQKIPKLRIVEGCGGIVADIENVQWAQWSKQKNLDENKPKLDIRHRDFLSCLKYGLATNLYHAKPKAKLYRRKQPVSTYGITDNRSKTFYRRKLGLRTNPK